MVTQNVTVMSFCAQIWSSTNNSKWALLGLILSLCAGILFRRVRMQWRPWRRRRTCWRGRSGTWGGRPKKPQSRPTSCVLSWTWRRTGSKNWRLSSPWWVTLHMDTVILCWINTITQESLSGMWGKNANKVWACNPVGVFVSVQTDAVSCSGTYPYPFPSPKALILSRGWGRRKSCLFSVLLFPSEVQLSVYVSLISLLPWQVTTTHRSWHQAASQIRFVGTSVPELHRCQATQPQNIVLPSLLCLKMYCFTTV